MSPRPLPSENAPFEPALALARVGQLREAIEAITPLWKYSASFICVDRCFPSSAR